MSAVRPQPAHDPGSRFPVGLGQKSAALWVELSNRAAVYYALTRKAGKPMSSERIANYRNQAELCLSRSETASDRQAMLHWLTIAEDWLLLADHVEMNEGRSAIKLVDGGDAYAAIGNWA